MTQEIIELAKQAGFFKDTPMYYDEEMIAKFFRLAYARGMLKQAEQGQHWSDCAVNSEPAYPAGECDCGGFTKGNVTIIRQWQGITEEEIRNTNHRMVEGAYHYSFKQGAEWAEKLLKEKNT